MTTTATSRPARLRRRVAGVLASAALVAGAVVGISAPAQAATSYATMTGCFQSSYTMYNTTYWGKYTGTAIIDAWISGQWRQIGTVGLSLYTGCASVNVPTGYQWRLRVNDYSKPYRYVGVSAYITPVAAPGAAYNLGTARLGSIYVG